MFLKLRKHNGQSVIEYSILIGIVAAAVISMTMYINRSVRGKMKNIESQMNEPVILQ
jgi:Flp pilus assembly pilin Flp